ncbi:MAG: tetratricopeptide repeat protein [Burkholderiales bacterium]
MAADADSMAGNRLAASQTFPLAADADFSETTVRVAFARVLLVAAESQPIAGEPAALAPIESRDLVPEALVVRGYLREGAAHKAVAVAGNFLERRPDDPALHQLMGTALLALGDARSARASFERALRRDPTYVSAIASLAQLDLQDGKTDVALKRYEDAAAKGCKSAALFEGYAALMRLSGLDRGDDIEALCKRTLASSDR